MYPSCNNDQPEPVSVSGFPFGDLSRDRQIIWCYLHHDRYLVTVMRSQKRLEPLANFHADAPSTDRSRRVATFCHHFVIDAVIVGLLSGAEGLPSGHLECLARIIELFLLVQQR